MLSLGVQLKRQFTDQEVISLFDFFFLPRIHLRVEKEKMKKFTRVFHFCNHLRSPGCTNCSSELAGGVQLLKPLGVRKRRKEK